MLHYSKSWGEAAWGTIVRGLSRDGLVCSSILLAGGLVLADCVRVPIADDAAKGPRINELVQRIKCDVYEAVQDRLDAPYGYEWLHSWTAQANLNLIVNDQSQISPGASFTQQLRTVTVPGYVTNFARSWNVGLGGQESSTASRNETITFTVSLEELRNEFSKGSRNCEFPDFIGLQSELGLKEWVRESLSPADNGFLKLGYHKAPKAGAGAATAAKAVTAGAASIAASSVFQQSSGKFKCTDSTQPAVNPPPPRRATKLSEVAQLYCDLFTVLDYDFTKLDGGQVMFIARVVARIQKIIRDRTLPDAVNKALEKTAIELTVFLDPPIDTITHQVQFIIVWNASVNPGWTLLHFKGPAPASGSLASVTTTKTHTLNIAIGPPSSPDAQGALNALQVGTAVSNALNQNNVTGSH